MTLGKIPIDLSKISKENIDKQILRAGILAELDAINLYEQMAAMTDNKDLKAVLLDVAKEEKEHVGEFQYLLLKYDKQQVEEMEDGQKEVKELLGDWAKWILKIKFKQQNLFFFFIRSYFRDEKIFMALWKRHI